MKSHTGPENPDRFIDELDAFPTHPLPTGFEERLYRRIRFLPERTLIRWLKWGIAALIALAITNLVVLNQISQDTDSTSDTSFIQNELGMYNDYTESLLP